MEHALYVSLAGAVWLLLGMGTYLHLEDGDGLDLAFCLFLWPFILMLTAAVWGFLIVAGWLSWVKGILR